MAAPLRIGPPPLAAAGASRGDEFKFYVERVVKLIPGEVVSAYVVGAGFIPSSAIGVQWGWLAFCFVVVIAIRAFATSDPASKLSPQWMTVLVSAVSFLIWTYQLGGPFTTAGLSIGWLASLLIVGWSLVLPIFYKGT